jgi:hypothetical protein
MSWTAYPASPKGIVGHVDCTIAYPEDGGDHTDPGPSFPWDVFLDLVREEMETDDMTKTELTEWMTDWAQSPAGREALAVAVLTHDPGAGTDGKVKAGGVENPDKADPNRTFGPAYALNRAVVGATVAYQVRDQISSLADAVAAIAKNVAADDADLPAILEAIHQARAAGVTDVLDGLTAAGRSDADIAAALRATLGDRAAAVAALLAG